VSLEALANEDFTFEISCSVRHNSQQQGLQQHESLATDKQALALFGDRTVLIRGLATTAGGKPKVLRSRESLLTQDEVLIFQRLTPVPLQILTLIAVRLSLFSAFYYYYQSS
jgi:hypothetical protein